MGFGEAIKTVFGNYANFSGRARRREFWFWVLFLFIVQIVTNILDSVFGTQINYDASNMAVAYQSGWISGIVGLALLIPTLAVQVRRLHDTDRSGWWWWIGLICCIGSIILLVFYIQAGTAGDNRFGPDPKGGAGAI